MVQAILEGRKTMTRRIIKRFSEINDLHDGVNWPVLEDEYGDYNKVVCPYGQVGDELWVREAFKYLEGYKSEGEGGDFGIEYLADGEEVWFVDNGEKMTYPVDERKRPSIHMPQWASRITLKITSIRVERLQDITEEDAEKEGVDDRLCLDCGNLESEEAHWVCEADYDPEYSYVGGFKALWNKINGKDSYDKNPWVWVVGFERSVK